MAFKENPQFSSVQLLSRVWLFATPWTAARQPPCPSPTPRVHPNPCPGVYWNSCPLSWWCHPINSSCHPLLLPPSIFPSIKVFSNESVLHIRWPKYWSFRYSISSSNEYSGRISFRMDWLDLLAVHGTLKSLQHPSSKASILQRSVFFIVQLSHPYMATGKTIALTRWTFVGKVMSLLFNMLSRLAITFLPRSKGLLISWLQSPSAEKPSCWQIPWYSPERGCNDGSLGAQGAKWLAETEEELWTGFSQPVAKQMQKSCVIREASLVWLLKIGGLRNIPFSQQSKFLISEFCCYEKIQFLNWLSH